jgi:hypothetical protein
MVSKFPKLIGFFVIGTLMISLVTFAILNILPEGNLSLEYDSEHINENLVLSFSVSKDMYCAQFSNFPVLPSGQKIKCHNYDHDLLFEFNLLTSGLEYSNVSIFRLVDIFNSYILVSLTDQPFLSDGPSIDEGIYLANNEEVIEFPINPTNIRNLQTLVIEDQLILSYILSESGSNSLVFAIYDEELNLNFQHTEVISDDISFNFIMKKPVVRGNTIEFGYISRNIDKFWTYSFNTDEVTQEDSFSLNQLDTALGFTGYGSIAEENLYFFRSFDKTVFEIWSQSELLYRWEDDAFADLEVQSGFELNKNFYFTLLIETNNFSPVSQAAVNKIGLYNLNLNNNEIEKLYSTKGTLTKPVLIDRTVMFYSLTADSDNQPISILKVFNVNTDAFYSFSQANDILKYTIPILIFTIVFFLLNYKKLKKPSSEISEDLYPKAE